MALSSQQVAVKNPRLAVWVDEIAKRTLPDSVIWCDGSDEEHDVLVNTMLEQGRLIELDPREYPNCYLYRSNPNDVARTEASTFICCENKIDAGPTNNWMKTSEAEKKLWAIFDGCMKGRTMYVVPYVMGPARSRYSRFGVQLTDSRYVVLNLKMMTRMGKEALEEIADSPEFVKGIHSMGTMDQTKKYICHFPESGLIMSINSNYGGNALLSKKGHALRLASVSARKEGWMAEHMLITGIQEKGEVFYITGAFPSASGKTNLAMLRPPEGYKETKVLLVGDDIAWLHLAQDGMLHAINPESGFFCVAPNTNAKTNPNLIETIKKNTIYTNVALTQSGKPWWEGDELTDPVVQDWQGNVWKKGSLAAHPNSRFTVSVSQYPCLSPLYKDPDGVPVSAILFGGRRASLVPLVYEAFSWEHGVLIGAMMNVETTAAAEGSVGVLKRDPMAMTPFCGYNMGDYFRHWLSFAEKSSKLPGVFQVNWFRRGKDGKFLWPGYSENIRVLNWIKNRAEGKVEALETPIGYVPLPGSIDTKGLDITEETMKELLSIEVKGWLSELTRVESFFQTFGERLPERLWNEFYGLRERLEKSAR
ncbi:MAG: phosphoenolpyruvate carboxykinase (GTP) [Nitrososphaerota archaeon]|nr:phosphoenolpyruvate carboxykinase (GTP) [Nitrososphaerota archaeon]